MHYVFISLPMNGKTDKEIGHRLCSINGKVKQACKEKFGWDWNDIRTIDNFWDHKFANSGLPVQHIRVLYLGEAIQKMAHADAIYFDEGWENSTGCQVERYVALKYEIPPLFYNVYGGVKDEEKEE